MIRIESNKGQIKVHSRHERISVDKVKRLFRIGNRISAQEKTSSLLILTNDTVRLDRYTLEYTQRIIHKLNQIAVTQKTLSK
ncbi:MAG: hypothetical protein COB15_12565 [Flavobacteriales bacterium]|nr:MAG: hypothetical protein COB15_12565 [Flavobacteriales bacterium]